LKHFFFCISELRIATGASYTSFSSLKPTELSLLFNWLFNPIYHVRCWSSTHKQHFSFYIDIITPTWQKTKWQFIFKYVQGQKSFGFTFYYWKLSNFQISEILIHWIFQNFQEFVRKINGLKKGSLKRDLNPQSSEQKSTA